MSMAREMTGHGALRRFLSASLACVLAAGLFLPAAAEDTELTAPVPQEQTAEQTDSYSAYRAANASVSPASAELTVDLWSGTLTGDTAVRTDIPGVEKALYLGEESSAAFRVNVPADGLYRLVFTYYTVEGKGSDIVRSLSIDGAVPFAEAEDLTFGRVWEDDGEVRTDYQGNEIRPDAKEIHTLRTVSPHDGSGYYTEPFCYRLTAGEHTLTLTAVKEPMALAALSLAPPEETVSYAEYRAAHTGADAAQDGGKIQAETMTSRSSKSIYATSSKSSAAMEPPATGIEKLNLIDGSKFKLPGQWITWTMTVPEDGFYQIAVRYKQSERDGAYCSRALLIDGEQPFAEAGALKFPYTGSWQTMWLSDDSLTPYRFWLTKGSHELTLSVTLGDMAELVGEVDRLLADLNTCYPQIYVITGSEVDIYRDYHFAELIPDTLSRMETLCAELKTALEGIRREMGTGSFTTSFENLIFDIEGMVKKPRNIASKMETFKSDLGALGEWQQNALSQPVSFDWLWAMSPSSALPRPDKGFFAEVGYQCRLFVSSFLIDYSSIGRMNRETDASSVKVWVTSGRDQSKIIRRMIDQNFTPEYDISVELQLVAAGTLLRSILAGNGPDVAMQLGAAEPMNYALRAAVTDLTRFDDYNEVAARFHENALKPFTYLGRVYALPETFTYPMLFVRTDIFEEMGWEIPQTWEDVYALIIQLSAYSMEFGLPFNNSTYVLMLMQQGVELYNEDRTAVNTTGDAALRTFNRWLSYYKDYGLSVQYDFANRFRSGEMPIGIADFVSTYNQLSVFAPEIHGQWTFVTVPGTTRENGTVDHTTNGGGTGVSILSSAKDPEACWTFLKWWTDAEAQVNYGTDLESILGAAARYASANKEAVGRTPWPVSDYRHIMEQWESVDCLPQAPGGYIVTRYLDFAAREVINQSAVPGQTVIRYTKLINEELERKKKEFMYNE